MIRANTITTELTAYGKIKKLITTKEARIDIIKSEEPEEVAKIENDIEHLKKVIEKVEKALNYICDEDRFIIDQKFVLSKQWPFIADNFNDKFARPKEISYHMLKKNLSASKKTLFLILRPTGEISTALKEYLE